MNYDEIAKKCEGIKYRDKLRLAPLLIQSKKKTLINSIMAMYQFQGGVSEEDIKKIIKDLEKRKFLKVEQNGRILYLK